jgi:hypothetical protein
VSSEVDHVDRATVVVPVRMLEVRDALTGRIEAQVAEIARRLHEHVPDRELETVLTSASRMIARRSPSAAQSASRHALEQGARGAAS